MSHKRPIPSTLVTDFDAAVLALASRLVGALAGVSLSLREDVVFVLSQASLADNALETMDPIVYSGGDLTLPINGDFNELAEASFSVGDRFLWIFTDVGDSPTSGVYTLTDIGSAGSPAVWTRAIDFALSGDFVPGAAVLAPGEDGPAIYRLNVSESFVLDTTMVKFDLIGPGFLVTAGTP